MINSDTVSVARPKRLSWDAADVSAAYLFCRAMDVLIPSSRRGNIIEVQWERKPALVAPTLDAAASLLRSAYNATARMFKAPITNSKDVHPLDHLIVVQEDVQNNRDAFVADVNSCLDNRMQMFRRVSDKDLSEEESKKFLYDLSTRRKAFTGASFTLPEIEKMKSLRACVNEAHDARDERASFPKNISDQVKSEPGPSLKHMLGGLARQKDAIDTLVFADKVHKNYEIRESTRKALHVVKSQHSRIQNTLKIITHEADRRILDLLQGRSFGQSVEKKASVVSRSGGWGR
ncbi:MAG TPA: hypothetical protein VGZ00_12350 [Candidatus Baltobacteraceae bacterium]|jgi:hypothetical protein|nr:hypothetical protein [Candidatus Baltobacteraceae bacterium]